MSKSDVFIGICSGMSHIAHSVGVPTILYEWEQLEECHPNKLYLSFKTIDECVDKINILEKRLYE